MKDRIEAPVIKGPRDTIRDNVDKIEALREENATLKAENEALKKQVQELQEWIHSHV